MTVNDVMTTLAQTARGVFTPDTWRIVLLLLVAWGVLLLVQIRGLLTRFLTEVQFRTSLPHREEPAPLDEISLG